MRLFLVLLAAAMPGIAQAAAFLPAEKLTDDSANFQLSRTANGLLAFEESSRTLLAVYWSAFASPSGDYTTPASPSHILYRTWNADTGWGAAQGIDDSLSAGNHVGGRHPSLALAPGGGVWVVWHDHRHCTAGGSWIDNIEIYGDFKPAAGAFSASDYRLTTTSAPSNGDNGYAPKIAVSPLGRFSAAWYDFNADVNLSDLYLKTSDAAGAFNLAESMATMKMTTLASRGGSPAFAFPDIAVDAAETRHLAWAGGLSGSGYNLYYASGGVGASSLSPQLLASGATSSSDPPHIAVASNGEAWVCYSDNTLAVQDLVLLRRRAGQPAFDAAIRPISSAARERFPDHEIGADGKVRMVWIDERAGRQVYYGVYNPALGQLVEERAISPSVGQWIRPTLALDAAGNVYVLFEERVSLSVGAIWFATTATPNAADPLAWRGYE